MGGGVRDHPRNYRSVVALGRARQELRARRVLVLALNEVSAKVRTGPPVDEEEDRALPVWAGVIPTGMELGEPVPDDRVPPGVPLPRRRRG